MAQHPEHRHDGVAGMPLDGRLDLDQLDLTTDLENLDVIGEDRPTVAETVAVWLEPTGILPVVRRHRRALVAGTVAVAVALAGGATWRATRPAPLPEHPRAFARAAGADPTASLVVDTATSTDVGVRQQVTITTAEPPGISVRAVGLAGPGLRPDPATTATPIAQTGSDEPIVLAAQLACDAPSDTTAVLAATPGDYVVELERSSSSGETRVDPVPIVGSTPLLDLVRGACLQRAADRDLRVTGITTAAVPGVVAVDVDLAVTGASDRTWMGVRVAAAAQPAVVNTGHGITVAPGETSHLLARLWPTDCADPAAELRQGVLMSADVGPDGLAPGAGPGVPSVLLRVPGQLVDEVQRVALGICGSDAPIATVTRARLREGGGGSSAGTVDLTLSLTTPGAGIVEVDHLTDSGVTGSVTAQRSPVMSVSGVAEVDARWRLPECQMLLDFGLPRLHVVLAGDTRRPYVVTLRGDALRPVLVRLCGDEVAGPA